MANQRSVVEVVGVSGSMPFQSYTSRWLSRHGGQVSKRNIMKLATYKDGSRDGQLVVVSRDLSTAHYATGMAQTLQQVLDDWNFIAPQLQDLYVTLNQGKARHAFPFDPRMCMAPLPRAFARWSSLAYAAHADRVWPQRQGGPMVFPVHSDGLLGACDDVVLPSEDAGIDFGAGVAVVTGDVAQGAMPDVALEGVRLLMLTNEWALRAPLLAETTRGFGVLHGQPAAAFSPVAVTPEELGEAWSAGRVHLPLWTAWNHQALATCDAGAMALHFGQLLAHVCKTRAVRAGAIVSSGPAMAAVQTHDTGSVHLRFGDTVRIEMKTRDGQNLFGAMEQTVAPLE
jgi:fumarylacetoacetate (FAA) hydrolase